MDNGLTDLTKNCLNLTTKMYFSVAGEIKIMSDKKNSTNIILTKLFLDTLNMADVSYKYTDLEYGIELDVDFLSLQNILSLFPTLTQEESIVSPYKSIAHKDFGLCAIREEGNGSWIWINWKIMQDNTYKLWREKN